MLDFHAAYWVRKAIPIYFLPLTREYSFFWGEVVGEKFGRSLHCYIQSSVRNIIQTWYLIATNPTTQLINSSLITGGIIHSWTWNTIYRPLFWWWRSKVAQILFQKAQTSQQEWSSQPFYYHSVSPTPRVYISRYLRATVWGSSFCNCLCSFC